MTDHQQDGNFMNFLEQNQWQIADVLHTPARQGQLLPVEDLPLAPTTLNFLQTAYPNGIYSHQKSAIQLALADKNVCMVTGTASGKSLVFQTAALDMLSRDPEARVMAIYPMKALSNEQQDRWQTVLKQLGPKGHAGRIDGNVPPGFRLGVLESSQVIVFTPDIIHAWVFSNLKEPAVLNYLRHVRMIVVDEVHAYNGVFGSNSAFLFRRLAHVLSMLGAHPTYICASATIAHPEDHLKKLLGQPFELIGSEKDTSPRYPLTVTLTRPKGEDRFLDEVVHLLEYLTQHTQSRFIAFVDSRKQVELISSILNRLLKAEPPKPGADAAEGEADAPAKPASRSRRAKPAAVEVPSEEEEDELEMTGVLRNLNVLPYRAGYEDHDRRQIQERLTEGTLNGVVSTSALELGIDIPHLDTCVLIGVPGSATSLQQRIGRIGRHGPGDVIVVYGGDTNDQAVFANPKSFFSRPLAESALYLENEHIQYIHALCLARTGGEHDVALAAGKHPVSLEFSSDVDWPEHFVQLCRAERAGVPPRNLMSLKFEARDRPNYTFPLRDVESQFKVERKDGPNVSSLGSLSFGQLMREAYPGAIYYYATVPYRVTRVSVKGKSVQVRREKRYTTKPRRTPPAIFPRLTVEGVDQFARQDELVMLECSLLARESITGVIEQRGRTEMEYPYPLSRELGFYQDQPYFSRNYFTTGVILTHPSLALPGVNVYALAAWVLEAFMQTLPFDRQDIGVAVDRFRSARAPVLQVGQPFFAIYDQTYGSLRLSRRLLPPAVLGRVLVEAGFLAAQKADVPAMRALFSMASVVFRAPRQALKFGLEHEQLEKRDPNRWERVVLPGSKGLMIRTNEEFLVQRILKTPAGLSYEGTPTSMAGAAISVMPLLTDVAEIPGESSVGWYDVMSGDLETILSEETLQVLPAGDVEASPLPDVAWLTHLFIRYFDALLTQRLSSQLDSPLPAESSLEVWLQDTFTRTNSSDLLLALLDVYQHEVEASYAEESHPEPESP